MCRTLKELARRWAPGLCEGFAKQGAHLANADIHESIRELRYYRAQPVRPGLRGRPLRRTRLALRRRAAGAGWPRNSQVSTTVSGLSDMLSMP